MVVKLSNSKMQKQDSILTKETSPPIFPIKAMKETSEPNRINMSIDEARAYTGEKAHRAEQAQRREMPKTAAAQIDEGTDKLVACLTAANG